MVLCSARRAPHVAYIQPTAAWCPTRRVECVGTNSITLLVSGPAIWWHPWALLLLSANKKIHNPTANLVVTATDLHAKHIVFTGDTKVTQVILWAWSATWTGALAWGRLQYRPLMPTSPDACRRKSRHWHMSVTFDINPLVLVISPVYPLYLYRWRVFWRMTS